MVPSTAKFTEDADSSRPAPISAPIRACVVDTGSLVAVASATQTPVPTSTASAKAGIGVADTMPLENSAVSLPASASEHSAPASVVTVPHRIAVR